MSYCLKSVTIRTNNDRIAEINEVWQDILMVNYLCYLIVKVRQ